MRYKLTTYSYLFGCPGRRHRSHNHCHSVKRSSNLHFPLYVTQLAWYDEDWVVVVTRGGFLAAQYLSLEGNEMQLLKMEASKQGQRSGFKKNLIV